MTLHLRPTAALAERALLPEDPGAAMALAQALLDRPLMFNHSRGLWGYTGTAADGLPLTIQSTGIGGPSAVIVLTELRAHGLRRAIRLGTCAALDGGLALGELVIAGAAITADGTGRALAGATRIDGVGRPPAPAAAADATRQAPPPAAPVDATGQAPAGAPQVNADAPLLAGLTASAPGVVHGRVASVDLFYAPGAEARWSGGDGGRSWRAQGAVALDLESAALFSLGSPGGVAVACVLVVAELFDPARRIDDESLAAALERAGRLGLAAFGLRGAT